MGDRGGIRTLAPLEFELIRLGDFLNIDPPLRVHRDLQGYGENVEVESRRLRRSIFFLTRHQILDRRADVGGSSNRVVRGDHLGERLPRRLVEPLPDRGLLRAYGLDEADFRQSVICAGIEEFFESFCPGFH